MVDTETMGTRYDAPLLAVGACLFEPENGLISKKFYRVVDMVDACNHGRVDGATLRFWMLQSDEPRLALTKGTWKLADTLTAFKDFYLQQGDIPIWSNGATFDLPIIEYAYRRCLQEAAPWQFWMARDCRTIEALAKGKYDRPKMDAGVAHNALDDAVFQAGYVSKMWQALRPSAVIDPLS